MFVLLIVKYLLLQISLVFSSASFHGGSYFEHLKPQYIDKVN